MLVGAPIYDSRFPVYDLRLTIYDTSIMEAAAQSPLVAWQTFFFLVGSSGAGLRGLQFVVIALIAEQGRLVDTDVQGVVIKGAGHWLMEEAPRQVIPRLVAFINKSR